MENEFIDESEVTEISKRMNGTVNKFLETESEKAERMKSLYVIYFTMFLEAFGYAFVISGIWPYLSKLDPTSTKSFYSLIIAANPLGQFISSPLIGYWTNKSDSIRLPIITSLAIFIISNILFSSLNLISIGVKYWMLISRFLTGVSSASVTVSRSYISAATKVDERTHALSMVSLAQVIGFIVAPLLQSGFTALKDDFNMPGGFHFNMYTAPGWMNVILGFTNIALFLSRYFNDHNIAVREHLQLGGKEMENKNRKTTKLDYFVIFSLIFSYINVSFNLVIFESLLTPLAMDQFAFSRQDALKWNGIIMGIGALVSCIIFTGLPRVTKIFKEIDILIWGGLFLAVLGKFVYIPYRNGPPKLAENIDDLGCPVKTQQWCEFSSALGVPEFVIGYFFSVIGYPIGMTLIQSLYSKTLGPRPQGIWMGIMASASSISRIIGPVIVLGSYTAFGTGYTFVWITFLMIIPMILLYTLKNRLTIQSPDNVELDDALNTL